MAVPVIPVGFIGDSTTMRQYYRASDLLAMPTLIDNLPNTIAEASACELPVVAFSVGGVPQMIDHDKTGMLVRYKDSVHLAECLNKMIHQTDRDAMGKAARQKAIHDYSEQAVAESLRRMPQPTTTIIQLTNHFIITNQKLPQQKVAQQKCLNLR